MQIIDIIGRNWKLTLPTGTGGKPTEIKMPALATYAGPYFYVNATSNGLTFVAPTDSVTTKNSKNPRSELREMNADGTLAAWSSTVGAHSMEVELTVDEFQRGGKPHVVIAQIHDKNDDVCVFRLEGNTTGDRTIGKLWITDGDKTRGHFVADVRLGERIRVGFHVQNGIIRFGYNGEPLPYEQRKSVTGCYFKAGCYNQAGGIITRLPDGSADFAQVTIYQLAVTHSDAVKPVDPPVSTDNFGVRLAALEATFYAYKSLTDVRFDAIKKAL